MGPPVLLVFAMALQLPCTLLHMWHVTDASFAMSHLPCACSVCMCQDFSDTLITVDLTAQSCLPLTAKADVALPSPALPQTALPYPHLPYAALLYPAYSTSKCVAAP